MKTVLVTGAAGFIGSHVSELLLKEGHHVIGVDNVNDYYSVSNKKNNLKLLSKYSSFSFVKADISKQKSVEKIFKSNPITHIAHLAARAGVRPSIQDPYIYEQANVSGTLNLLEAAVKHKISNFVLTSSSSVYGNSKKTPFREDDAATDFPISPYAATKKSTEVMGYTYHHLYGLNVNVIRPFTVYGPRGRPDMAPWMFLDATLTGKKIKRFGDGSTRRDYTYVGDFARGFVNAIFRPYGYEIFNLGNSQTVSLSEALAIVSKVAGKQQIIEEFPMQPGDVEVTFADISKAKNMLDYNPSTSFEEGMTLFHEWFVKNILKSNAAMQATAGASEVPVENNTVL